MAQNNKNNNANQKGQEQPVQKPRVSGFKISAKRVGSLEEVFNVISKMTFLEIANEPDALVAINIESRDIQKNPHLFSVTYFRENKLEIMYTYLPGMSPKKRRLDMLKYFLNILTLVEDIYDVDNKQIYQLLEKAIEDMNEYVTADYEKLYSTYDNLKNEIDQLREKVKNLKEGNNNLAKENYELKARNDDLVLRVKELEAYSEDVLKTRIQEWITEHRGEINISEFSKVHKVPETRVEEILNTLVMEGYLQSRR